MSKYISRKNFLKNLGLISLSSSGLSVFSENNVVRAKRKDDKYVGITGKKEDEWNTRRGSWVKKSSDGLDEVILTGSGMECQIVVSEREHSAVRQAAQFLSEDINKITGQHPEITSKPDAGKVHIYLVTLDNKTIPDEIEVNDIKDKWEAHKIVTFRNSVWLIGADFRGTAFATYTLSERLGIDPLYLWTGYYPIKHETLILKETNYKALSPTFKYRGFFHDDEDILPRPFDWDGYPLKTGDINIDWYQKYFETALRLRMNMVAPYTRVHRRYEVQKCAGDWGLFYTSHHYDILLSNPYGFKRFNLAEKREVKPEWSWNKNRTGMVKYWKGGVVENKDLACIWPVGLRGMGDAAYDFSKGTTDAEKIALFNQVIKKQISIVEETADRGDLPVYTLTLWDEVMEMYKKNIDDFKLPEDVIIVWSDNMDGRMNNLPQSLGKWKHGIYYHLAMYGGWVTKQNAHIVSPAVITEAIRKTVNAGATEFILINVSELREFVMEARLLSEICWDASSLLNEKEPDMTYINWWGNEYFGPYSTDEVVRVYQQYYKILNKPENLWYAADVIKDQLYQLGKKFNNEAFKSLNVEDNWRLETRAGMYQDIMQEYEKAVKGMNKLQQQFFFENTRLGLSFDWRPTQTALLLEEALKEKDINKSWEYIYGAIKPLEQLELDILKAERPPFANWYRETWVRNEVSTNNVHRSYSFLRAFISSHGKTSQFPIEPFRTGNENTPQYQEWTKFIEKMKKLK